MTSQHARILFIAPIGIGNVLLLIPTLKACKQALPRSWLAVVVTNRPSQEILLTCPYVDEVILLNLPVLKSALVFLKQLKCILRLRRRPFDVSITAFPCNHACYNLLAFAVGAPVRMAHRYRIRQGRSLSFLQNVRIPMQRVHDVEQNLNLLASFSKSSLRVPTLELWIPEEARKEAQQFLEPYREHGDEVFIGMHAGSSTTHQMAIKRWPAERFAQLMQQLLGEYPRARAFLFGGKEEIPLNHVIEQQLRTCPQVHPSPVVFHSASILQTAAVIERMSVFISNDSGLMHIAAAVGVPTVAIFGPTDPSRTAPYGKGHNVVRHNLACSPCWQLEETGRRKRCPHATCRCLTELSVSSVAAVIKV